MRIWIVKASEPLPISGSARLMRASALAETLAQREHEVIYWASTFHHRNKAHLPPEALPAQWGSGVEMRYLHGPPYSHNISLSRLKNHREEARAFSAAALKEARPDIIMCCMPTMDLAEASVNFGRDHNVPVLIDIRDMWPEAFALLPPPAVRPLARLALWPFYRQFARLTRGATGIVGISEGFVDYGLKYAKRPQRETEAVFHTSFSVSPSSPQESAKAGAFWEARGLRPDDLVACYVGTLTPRARPELLRAVSLFRQTDALRDWKLVLCGGGELEADLRAAAEGQPNIDVVGWVGRAEVADLLDRSSLGIIPYPNEADYLAACPNKFGEYLSAGLPVLSFLRGEVGELVRRSDCGWVYASDEEFVAALKEVRSDPAGHLARRRRSKSLFDQEFDAGQIYGAFANHIEKMAIRGR